MSDTDRPLGVLTPALPSRATGEAKPLTPLPAVSPMDNESPAPAPRRKPAKKAKVKKPQRLPAREIKRINKNRSKNLSRRQVVRNQRKATKAAPPAEKSRNRPLEAKTRLHSVLAVVSAMSRQEATAFTGMMQHLEDMSRPARQRVISALQTVYS